MRAMRACATVNAAVLGLALSVGSFAACSSGSSTSANAPDNAAPSADPTAPVASATAHAPPPTGAPQSTITNEPPDGGVVMNNAQTAADAGASDRFQPMVDAVKANRDDFRKCFDQWSAKNPGRDGKVVYVWSLKPDGSLMSSQIDVAKSTVAGSDIEACFAAVAKKMAYPKSPSGKETKFTYPFDFKAHNK